MTESVMIVCADPRASHMVYAAPFPAPDPGSSIPLGKQWMCLGWATAGDPYFNGRTRLDVVFLESLGPVVRAIADAPRDAPAAPDGWALVIDSSDDGERVTRSFVPQAKPGVADESDETMGTRITFTLESHLIDGERFSVRRYTTGDSERVPFFCA